MRYKNIEFTSQEIIFLLEQLGFTNITEHFNLFQFSWYEGANPKGSCLYKNNLKFTYWSKNLYGDLIDLITYKKKCSFNQALYIFYQLTNKISIDFSDANIYNKILNKIKKRDYVVYGNEVLNYYEPCISQLFLKDDVGLLAQSFFDIRIDKESNRIVFPIKDINGNIVGILGRYNTNDVPIHIAKYLPILIYDRKFFLFGAYENKDYLHDTIILVESEKSVMKAFSKGYRNVVALGGNYFNSEKLNILYELKPKKVILALDEGLNDEHIRETAKSLISPNPFIKWKVGYIESNYVGLGHKNCIFDETLDKCKYILDNNVITIH